VAKVAQSELPRGVRHAKSAGMWGQRPFSNISFRGMFFNFFFCKDENQNWPKLQRRKSYL